MKGASAPPVQRCVRFGGQASGSSKASSRSFRTQLPRTLCPFRISRPPYSTSTYVSCLPRSSPLRLRPSRQKGRPHRGCDRTDRHPASGPARHPLTPVTRPADHGRSFRDAQVRRPPARTPVGRPRAVRPRRRAEVPAPMVQRSDVGNIAAHRRRPRPRHPRHAAVPTFASYQVRNVTVTQPYARPTAHATSSGTAMFV